MSKPQLVEYRDGKLVIDLNLLPQGESVEIKINGGEFLDFAITYRSNLSFIRHGSWSDHVNKKLAALPGARIPSGS